MFAAWRIVAIAACLLVVPSMSSAADPLAPRPQLPENIATFMKDRNYAEAVKAIDQLLVAKPKEGETLARDYLAYLKGRALHLDQKYDAAIAAFKAVGENTPKSDWVRRARFAAGVSHARKGEFQQAELIYRAEAEYLLSLDRKQEIADIYLEFADAFFKPPQEDQAPDYAKALEFYKQALDVGPLPESRIQIELRIAESHEKLGQFPEAAELYRKFIEAHANHELVIEARFRLGESLLAAGSLEEARRAWRDLLDLHKEAVSPRLAEAAFRVAATYQIPTPPDQDSLNLGIAALRDFLKKHPEHELAPKAHLQIAQAYQHQGRHEDAVSALNAFLADERYVKSDEAAEAQYLLGFAYRLQKKFDEAIKTFNAFLAAHPTHRLWASAQQEIINAEYFKAYDLYEQEKYAEARALWDAFLVKHPLDARNRAILYLFGRMAYAQEQWNEAVGEWRRLVSKYPETNEASRAQYMIALTLEEKLGKLEDALKEYKKVTYGELQGPAQTRVQRLTSQHLRVATEQVFRSNETPTIKVTTRNIDCLTVSVYTVDLETYFRKMHLATGVENLDISLIDPDRTFEYAIPEYEKYKEFASQVEIPLPGKEEAQEQGAVTAVTVSSKTFQATTLVVQSDLDIIVKSSRDEVFVFAQNMRTGKPWPKAKVLISDGAQVFAESATGDDGVLQQSFDELRDANDVRVFAMDGSHTASNLVSLSGVGVAQGLENKGYIYTDRPAYQPGQMVHVRGVIRQVTGDTYTVAEGKEYHVEVFDVRNRLIHETNVKLSAFGGLHTNFLLPSVAPQGEFRILVREPEKDGGRETYQGVFTVREYQLEPVRLEVDTERNVYYRGEAIEGVIRATFYYGAPLANRELQYQLAGGRTFTAATDDKGEVRFTFPTREFRESQTLLMTVVLPERNLQTGKQFFLATQGFNVTLSTVRDVYIAGETFDVSLTARDAEGEPTARDVKLHVLRQTTVAKKSAEVETESHELKTDAKSGEASVTLKLAQGGSYVLRAEGVDQFGNPVTGQTYVTVSDEKDAVRLRILADKHTFKVGDTAKVQVHWREAPALALVTYQGARILEHRLVQLETGANELPVPMSAKLAPNFELAVAVMTNARPTAEDPHVRRFHEASAPFLVTRNLQVSVALARQGEGEGPLKPGEAVVATITTVDSQGQPASAELSLAMVEQSLLERFASPLGKIDEFFRGALRQSAVRTTSSVVFEYRPSTQAINARLLAEEERLALGEMERRRLSEFRERGAVAEAAELDGVLADAETIADFDAFTESLLTERSREAEFAGEDLALAAGAYAPANGAGYGYGMGGLGGGAFGGGSMPGQPSPGMDDAFAQPNPFGEEAKQSFEKEQMANAPAMPQSAAGVPFGGAADGRFLGRAAADPNVALKQLAQAGDQVDQLRRKKYAASEAPLTGVPATTYFSDVTQWDVKAQANAVQVLSQSGEWFNLNMAKARAVADRPALVARLTEQGAMLMPQLGPHETGYWNPAVVTDKDGKTTIEFELPDRSTAWTLQAKGATVETLAGEAEHKFTVKKDLFGELKLPLAFTDGDQATILASVHHAAMPKGQVEVTLRATIGEKTVTQTRKLDVEQAGVRELAFPVKIELPAEVKAQAAPGGNVVFELTVASGDQKDVIEQSLPVRPYGMPVVALAGGSAEGDTTAFVEEPQGMKLDAPQLQIVVGPSVERSLLDVLLAPPMWCEFDVLSIRGGVDGAASDIMAALALQQLFKTSQQADHPQLETLDTRVRSSVGLLVSMQNDDGSWSWAGRGAANRYSTARSVWALALARKAGYRVDNDAFQRAVTWLQAEMAKTRVNDYETKAVLLHALSVAGQGDFTLANQLYRNRPSLSPAGLAYLALAFAEMDRKPTAEELLTLLGDRLPQDDTPTPAKTKQPAGGQPTAGQAGAKTLPWNASSVELRALYALALNRTTPASPQLKAQVDWLLAHRTGNRWSPEKATGPAMLVLGDWYARTRFAGERYELTIYVNDLLLETLTIDAADRTQTVEVPAKLLAPGRQRVRFELKGRGRYTYQCVLGGFVPSERLKSTTNEWRVTRYYEPAPVEFDGKPVGRGFDVLAGSYSTFRNPLSQLPVARRASVTIETYRQNVSGNTPDEELPYLVITEPLPAGVTVVENSLRGEYDRYEISPGAITFYLGNRRWFPAIQFDVYGYLPGEYRSAPTNARNAYRPDQIAVADVKALTVLPQGAKSDDPYRLTPRELYELGSLHFAKQQHAKAIEHLGELVSKWTLQDAIYKDSVRMLLDAHLAAGPPEQVVHYFEIIIEKYPDLEISFSKLLRVGDAYHQIGEYERSYLVFRATVEASFQRESRVAGFLEGQSEFPRSVKVMADLLREYPPEPYLAAAHYALAQRVYAKAPEAANDEKLKTLELTRVDLIDESLAMLNQFLTEWPDDPAADEASFSVAGALLDLKAYQQAIAACQAFEKRYPESRFLDSYWYIIGFCHYALGDHEKALEVCRRVAEYDPPDRDGRRVDESPNKWQAVYILGQIYHSLGKAEPAIDEYRRVEDRFPDASQAIEYFLHKEISLPEVTSFLPGQEAAIELTFRNLPTCEVTVYRIDLMKFSLLRRSLEEVTRINLAGIRPFYHATEKLGDGKDYRDRKTPLKLPLAEEGAYLVVARGDDLYASGLVLVSPLVLEVDEDVASGRVRATVRNAQADRYAAQVHVKAIGSANEDFLAGETDLRGVYIADGVRGEALVIAQGEGSRFAFYRGKTWLGPPQEQAAAEPQAAAEAAPSDAPSFGKDALLKNVQEQQQAIQKHNSTELQQLYDNKVDEGIGGGFGGGFF
jgi:uncharacterized protein YfaS (alpha-2-macroglobulin family)/tetratricopeptide (TPR) repeat protein